MTPLGRVTIVLAILLSSCGVRLAPGDNQAIVCSFGVVDLGSRSPLTLTVGSVVRLTPYGSTDYVTYIGGSLGRFVTSSWRADNLSERAINNLTLHAYAPVSASLSGTAFTRLASSSGEPILDPSVALSTRPTHAMEPGFLAPRVSAEGARFQAFTVEEVAEVQRAGLQAGLLAEGDVVLGYGFSVSAPGGVIPDGGSGTLTISYRIPGANGPTAPYFMDVAFLVCEDRDSRITRSLEEGSETAGVLARADALPGARVVLLGTPSQAEVDAVTAAGRAVTIVPSVSLSSGGSTMP